MAAIDFAPARATNPRLGISTQTERTIIPAVIRGEGNSQENDARSHISQSKSILALTPQNVRISHVAEGILRKGRHPRLLDRGTVREQVPVPVPTSPIDAFLGPRILYERDFN